MAIRDLYHAWLRGQHTDEETVYRAVRHGLAVKDAALIGAALDRMRSIPSERSIDAILASDDINITAKVLTSSVVGGRKLAARARRLSDDDAQQVLAAVSDRETFPEPVLKALFNRRSDPVRLAVVLRHRWTDRMPEEWLRWLLDAYPFEQHFATAGISPGQVWKLILNNTDLCRDLLQIDPPIEFAIVMDRRDDQGTYTHLVIEALNRWLDSGAPGDSSLRQEVMRWAHDRLRNSQQYEQVMPFARKLIAQLNEQGILAVKMALRVAEQRVEEQIRELAGGFLFMTEKANDDVIRQVAQHPELTVDVAEQLVHGKPESVREVIKGRSNKWLSELATRLARKKDHLRTYRTVIAALPSKERRKWLIAYATEGPFTMRQLASDRVFSDADLLELPLASAFAREALMESDYAAQLRKLIDAQLGDDEVAWEMFGTLGDSSDTTLRTFLESVKALATTT